MRDVGEPIRSIGTIGAGPVARAVAGHALRHGLSVVFSNSRGPASLDAIVEEAGPGAAAGDLADAMACDLVLLALPFDKIEQLGSRREDWSGPMIVDATNQFATSAPYRGRALVPGGLTGSEWVSERLPGANIVKAFNAMFATYIAPDPRHEEGRQVVLTAGDDADAKRLFSATIGRWGFAAVDLGGLRDGGALMQLDGALNGMNMLLQG